jgi:hypothetical protein
MLRSPASSSCALLLAAWIGCGDDPQHAEPADGGSDAAAPSVDAGAPALTPDGGARGPKLSAEASFLGLCNVHKLATDPSQCTGYDPLLVCVKAQCGFDACRATCQDYVQCLAGLDDPCPGFTSCSRTDACTRCTGEFQACAMTPKCFGIYSCATATPGGTCSKLEACCATQRSPLACTSFMSAASGLRGDQGCDMLLHDPGFLRAYASDPPCAVE